MVWQLDGVNFLGTKLIGSSFQKASLKNSSFVAANLNRVNFTGADLRGRFQWGKDVSVYSRPNWKPKRCDFSAQCVKLGQSKTSTAKSAGLLPSSREENPARHDSFKPGELESIYGGTKVRGVFTDGIEPIDLLALPFLRLVTTR